MGTLALQTYFSVGKTIADGGTLGDALWTLAGYFTILTNLLVAITMTAVALGRWPGGRMPSHATLAAVALYIAIVGVIFHLLLSKQQHFTGLWEIANTLLHYASPGLTVVFWLDFAPKSELAYRHALYWLGYPLAYCAYAFVRGYLTNWYPYPFIDVNELGLERALANSAGLALGVYVASLIVIFVTKALSGRRS